MAALTFVSPATIAKAKQVWYSAVTQAGRTVSIESLEGVVLENVRAFTARPKIMGLFDRTEQSYDQEKYVVMLLPDAFGEFDPEKFVRLRWEDEDHLVLSKTQVRLHDTLIGWRVLVKG